MYNMISASLVEANETNAPNLKRCKNFGSIFFNYIHLLSKTCCTVVHKHSKECISLHVYFSYFKLFMVIIKIVLLLIIVFQHDCIPQQIK